MIAPPFAYYGGKTTLAPIIASLLPEHQHYVEPFAGSLAVLLAKDTARLETVNDLDHRLMTFWRVLRDQPAELARLCYLTPHSRAEHQASYEVDGLDELEVARRVWVTLTQGRGNTLRRTGWRHFQDPSRRGPMGMPGYLQAYVDRMAPAVDRLRQVSLECREGLEVVREYGKHEEVCIYADPPYLGSVRSSRQYVVEMSHDAEHEALAEALRACRSAVVLSGYHSPLYDDLYAGWHVHEMRAFTGQANTNGSRIEVLWSNRPLAAQAAFTFDGGAA
jgi:DNA adenine methylase